MHLKTAEAQKYFLVFSARKDGVRAIGPAEEVGTDGGIPGATFGIRFRRDGTKWHVAPRSPKSLGRQPRDSGSEPPPRP